jgi:5-dehydro-4-deoxyglucarate dehydratase
VVNTSSVGGSHAAHDVGARRHRIASTALSTPWRVALVRAAAGSELHGLWGFVLSPFSGGELDTAALARAAALQAEAGVDVLCCCGAIAQAAQLEPAERDAALAATVRAARGEVPVVLALPADDDAPAAALRARELGARGLLLLPVSESAAAMQQTLGAIAACAPELALVLYHRPPLLLAPEELVRLCACPELAGVKDGHRDARLYRRLRGAVPERLTWIVAYEDLVLPFGAIGAEAFAPVSASYAPGYARAYLGLLAEGDLEGVRRLLEAHAYPLMDLRFSRPHIDVAVVKEAQRACGVPAGAERPPQELLTAAEEREVAQLVGALRSAVATSAGTLA